MCSSRTSSAVLVIATLFVAGCAPAVRVMADDQDTSLKDEDCEVVVLRDGEQARPPGESIGYVKVSDTGFSFNCSEKDVNAILRKRACLAGADVIYVTSWKTPSFASTCYRAEADLYKLGDSQWPTLGSSRADIVDGLERRSSEGLIHPIEGIWIDKEREYEIAIIPDSRADPGDFVAVILEAREYPWWKPMEIKAEFKKATSSGAFEIKYYLADRSVDVTSGILEDKGKLTIRLRDPGASDSVDSLWFRKYPPAD